MTPEAKKKVKGLLQLTPKCTIDIGISDKNKKRFEFTIIGSDNKQSDEYTLVAQSSEERQEWINILNASISKTATPSASPRNSMPIQNSNTPLSENRNSQVRKNPYFFIIYFYYKKRILEDKVSW